MSDPPRVRCPAGALQGSWSGGVARFAGIPFAQPPVGERRWALAEAHPGWEGSFPALEFGPAPIQAPGRLDAILGALDARAFSEDCLTLNVWTPMPGATERLPVLVYLYGGGYLTGSSSARWYDAASLAARGPAVLVTLNYRLGALGFAHLTEELTGGPPLANLGLGDQCLALEWVAANIASFGGDPDNVTLFGQSAGAHAIVMLHGMARANGLFRRAIVQSAPLEHQPASAEHVARSTRLFVEASGARNGTLAELRRLTPERILAAQRAALLGGAVFGTVAVPFGPVVDPETLPQDPLAPGARHLNRAQLLIGYTTEEARAWYAIDPTLWQLAPELVRERLRAQRGEQVATRFERYAALHPGEPGGLPLSQMVSDEMFIAPALRLADRLAERGAAAHLYSMAWRSHALDGRLGACHCVELPFVFGNLDRWQGLPLLDGSVRSEIEPLASCMQEAWLGFAAEGNAAHARLPPWPAHGAGEPAVMRFDLAPALDTDGADGRRELWNVPATR